MSVIDNRDADGHDVDLFDFFCDLPWELQEVITEFDSDGESELSYIQCEEFLRCVEALGYTFEYGLDGIPFGLQKM